MNDGMSCLKRIEIRKLSLEWGWYVNKCVSMRKSSIRSDVLFTCMKKMRHIFFSLSRYKRANWFVECEERKGCGVYLCSLINNVGGIV